MDEGANLYAMSDDGMLAMDFAEGDEEVMAVLLGAENEVGEDALALDWSEEELEALIQKAMDREPVVNEVASSSSTGSLTVTKINGDVSSKNLPSVEEGKEPSALSLMSFESTATSALSVFSNVSCVLLTSLANLALAPAKVLFKEVVTTNSPISMPSAISAF